MSCHEKKTARPCISRPDSLSLDFFPQLFEVSSSQTRLAVLLPFLLEILRFVFLQVFILRHLLEQFKTGFEAALASEKWKTVWKNRRIMFYLSLCVFKMSVAKRVQGT